MENAHAVISTEEHELAIIGCLLMDNDLLDDVDQNVEPGDFYNRRYRSLFEIVVKMISEGNRADLVTVGSQHPEYATIVSEATSSVHATANVVFHCQQVHEAGVRRKIRRTAQEAIQKAGDRSENMNEVAEHFASVLSSITETRGITYQPIRASLKEALDQFEVLHRTGGMIGIPSGFKELDQLTGGFVDSEMTIIGARASIGKTAFALCTATNIAEAGTPVGFFSLEMKASLLAQRQLCAYAGIRSDRIRGGEIRAADFSYLTDAAGKIYELPLYTYDVPGARLLDIKSKARQMVKREGVKIIFIDYVGLVRVDQRMNSRWEQIGYISSELRSLAGELNVPVVALSQVNRDAEGKPPTLANLRESGNLEQDADVVMLLHRDRDQGETKVMVEKHRNGPTGVAHLFFNMALSRFEEVLRNDYQEKSA